MKQLILVSLVLIASMVSCNKHCEPNPSYTSTMGCGDFMVYAEYNVPNYTYSYIRVNMDKDSIEITKEYTSYDLLSNPVLFSNIESFNLPFEYCNDAINPNVERLNTWNVKSGTVKVRMVREPNDCELGYVIDVEISDAVYEDSSGNTISVEKQTFDNVVVGWYAG